jgi:S1-C subfamily serine protease
MKTNISTLIAALLLTFSVFGQSLDGYKYIYVPTMKYQNGEVDIWGIAETVKNTFSEKGFIILTDEVNPSSESDIKNNPGSVLECFINHSNTISITVLSGSNNVKITLKNFLNEIVYKSEGDCGAADYRLAKEFQKCTKRALENFQAINYSFDQTKTPEIKFPEVEMTKENEESIKSYLTLNKLDPIEGIYKSYQNNDLSYYKIGIIKSNDKYKAIILESEIKHWKLGQVKAYFEHSSMNGFYSTKWYMGNKTSVETFANMDNDALLTIELKNQNGEKSQSKFIKMFPSASSNITYKKETSKSSGSGFFLSSSGIIATNAHVISGASKIEVVVSNEIGTFTYKTKILLSDNKNDVALLQIDDSTFKGLSSIPYGLSEKGEVGEKVFTIGYPLNDVMGTNYKLTDGIISSKSGIEDDIRYYQISVPIQPGNSGGPLFNKDGTVIGITSSKLNSKAVGTDVQNVNYAIKASYLLNLYNMLPNPAKIETTSQVANKQLQDQVKVLKNYVCLIKVY